MKIVFWIIMRKIILCDANQITIPRIKVILSRKNWSHLTTTYFLPKISPYFGLDERKLPLLGGAAYFYIRNCKKGNYHQEENGFRAKLEFKYL